MSSEFTGSDGTTVTSGEGGLLVLRRGGRYVELVPLEQVEIGAWLMAHGRTALRKRRAEARGL